MVKCYKYLWFILHTSGKTFNLNIKENAASTICAIADIQSLSKLSLETAMKLFENSTNLNIQHGNPMEHLGENCLKTSESIKATYLKMALRVSRYTSLWLVHALTRKSLLMQDLWYKLLLPSINTANKLIIQR
jgi:hypothetical protein